MDDLLNRNLVENKQADTLTNYLNEHNLFVSTRSFELILQKWPTEPMEEVFEMDTYNSFISAQLLGDWKSDDFEIFNTSDGFDINTIPPIPPAKHDFKHYRKHIGDNNGFYYKDYAYLDSEEKAFLRSVIKAVQRPTQYLTTKGLITVNYDTDLFHFIRRNRRGLMDIFYELFQDFFANIENTIYLLHFAD